ncbi:hypothetical protein SMC26_39505 [Actinomadura fulvescens]|uniref:Uncharacterized protein n=1 Tax=Actinomadura fulvescens TaxID=46160 RepID=A0ABN3PZI7_9ACTN
MDTKELAAAHSGRIVRTAPDGRVTLRFETFKDADAFAQTVNAALGYAEIRGVSEIRSDRCLIRTMTGVLTRACEKIHNPETPASSGVSVDTDPGKRYVVASNFPKERGTKVAEINPAPKPSQKTTTRRKAASKPATKAAPAADTAPAEGTDSTAVEKTDKAKEGVATWSPEFLRKDPAKRKALLESPDGTPGKDMAVAIQAELDREAEAAPIVEAAVKEAKTYAELHGKAAKVTRALAEKLLELRMVFTDARGNPDLKGNNSEYKALAYSVYEKAGFDSGMTQTAQGAVRYHMSDVVRDKIKALAADGKALKGEDGSTLEATYEAWCEYYGINPLSVNERRQVKAGGTKLPATVIPTDDLSKAFTATLKYAHKALEAPGDADPNDLPEESRKAVREELEAIRDRVNDWLESMGDV